MYHVGEPAAHKRLIFHKVVGIRGREDSSPRSPINVFAVFCSRLVHLCSGPDRGINSPLFR